MSDLDLDQDDDGYEPDDDWDDDPRGSWEPDPEDAEIARAYAEHYEHCDEKHGGGQCDCRPSRIALLRNDIERRLWYAGGWLRALPRTMQAPRTVRLGPAEITLRLRPRNCMACNGEGWRYSKTGTPDLRPEGYNGVGLCGCGAAIAKLADDRRAIRQAQTEPPF